MTKRPPLQVLLCAAMLFYTVLTGSGRASSGISNPDGESVSPDAAFTAN